MTENESSKFTIGQDDNPESIFIDEFQGLKLEKLSRRITLITILIPCLIGAIVFLVYRDINTRVGQVSHSGTARVQTLSKGLAAVSGTQKDLSKRLAALENTATTIQKNLKEAATAIKYIRSARRADNKKISNAINSLNQSLATLTPIPQELEKLAADIKNINDQSTKEWANIAQSIENIRGNLLKIETDLIAMAAAKIDHKTLDAALKKQQKDYQKLLDQTSNAIDQRILSLERQMRGSKAVTTPSNKTNRKTVTSSQKANAPEPAPATVAPQPTPEEKTAQNTTLPKPGTFIEQDIKQ